jgi:hypothetical protein
MHPLPGRGRGGFHSTTRNIAVDDDTFIVFIRIPKR